MARVNRADQEMRDRVGQSDARPSCQVDVKKPPWPEHISWVHSRCLLLTLREHQMMPCDSRLRSWTCTFRRWELRRSKYHTVRSVESCFSSPATLGNALVLELQATTSIHQDTVLHSPGRLFYSWWACKKMFFSCLKLVTVYATSEFIFKNWNSFLMSRI